MKKEDFLEGVEQIRTCYPNQSFLKSEKAVETWFKYFRELRKPFYLKAVDEHIKENRFVPGVSEILERYKRIESDYKAKRHQILSLYYLMRSIYPPSLVGDDKDDIEVFWKVVGGGKYEQCYEKAECLKALVTDYVSRSELTKPEAEWATFSMCMKGAGKKLDTEGF